MPQKIVPIQFEGQEYKVEVPDDATMDEIISVFESQAAATKRPIGASGEWKEPLMDKVKRWMPTPRDAARVGGGLVGGAIGGAGGTILGTPIGGIGGAAMGGAAGASIGESVYQLANRALGGEAPETGGEAAMAQTGALIQGAAQEGFPAWIASKLPQQLRKAAADKVAESVQAGQQPLGIKRNVAKVAGEVLDDFPVARSSDSLLNKIDDIAKSAIQANEAAYSRAAQSNVPIDAAPIISEMSKEMAKSIHRGAPIPGLETKVQAYRQVIDWLQQNPKFTVSDFRKAKQAWDSTLNYNRAGLAPDPAKVAVIEDAANAARAKIHELFPETAMTDKAVHAWSTLKESLQRAVDKTIGTEGLMQIMPRSAIGGSIGAGVALQQGESPYTGALIGGTLGLLSKTAAWNTLSAKERLILAKALESKAGPIVGSIPRAVGLEKENLFNQLKGRQ